MQKLLKFTVVVLLKLSLFGYCQHILLRQQTTLKAARLQQDSFYAEAYRFCIYNTELSLPVVLSLHGSKNNINSTTWK